MSRRALSKSLGIGDRNDGRWRAGPGKKAFVIAAASGPSAGKRSASKPRGRGRPEHFRGESCRLAREMLLQRGLPYVPVGRAAKRRCRKKGS
jgi:hypothetical protein